MVEAEGVNVTFTADDKDVNARLDNLERRLERAKDKGKKGGKAAGAAFFGGFAGGAAGIIAGGIEQSGPVSSVMDLLMNVLGAALLPIMESLIPLLKELSKVAGPIGDAVNKYPGLGTGIAGAAEGSYIAGPPGAVVGGAAGTVGGGITDLEDMKKQREAEMDRTNPGWRQEYDAWVAHNKEVASNVTFWDQLTGNAQKGQTAYDKAVTEAIGQELATGKPHTNVIPPQDPGLPYDPWYPPPNVGDLHGPTVVNTG